jgi:hypothetical protein
VCDERDFGLIFGPPIEEANPPPFDPSKPYLTLFDKERHAAIKIGAAAAVLPPIFVLALGSALVWAFRGFR